MKICRVLLSGLLITSYFISSTSNHGVYYSELKALKKAPSTKGLFDEDIDGGSHTTQCNLAMYKPILPSNNDRGFFSNYDNWRQALSLGTIQRDIVTGKELSLIGYCLQAGLCGIGAELIIVTPETMPALYSYVDYLSKQANVKTPVLFVSLKKGFFKAFSRKVLMFTGSVVVGQQLLHDLTDEEIEALVAQQIGHINCNHTNKNFLLKVAILLGFAALLKQDNNISICDNKLFTWFAAPVLSSLFIGKRFEKQADIFACKVAQKSNGLIKFYERLQKKDQLRATEFDVVSKMLQENAADIPMLTYLGLNIQYYLAKAEHCVVGTYNKFAYPSHKARIAAAKKYLPEAA